MKTKFTDNYFDERKFAQLCSEFDKAAEDIATAVQALREEGLPTEKKFIETITRSDVSLRDYIRALAKEKTEASFMPIDERSRIIGDYNAVLSRIDNKAQRMRSALSKVAIKADGDSISVDLDTAQERARKACTTPVDATAMQEYYDEILKLKKSLEAFRRYEQDHGLPSFEAGLWKDHGKYTMQTFIDKYGCDPGLFQELTLEKFKK